MKTRATKRALRGRKRVLSTKGDGHHGRRAVHWTRQERRRHRFAVRPA